MGRRTSRKRPMGKASIDALRYHSLIGQNGKTHAAVLPRLTLCGASPGGEWDEPIGEAEIDCLVCQQVIDVICEEFE